MPVSVAEIVVMEPEQIVALPVTVAVGPVLPEGKTIGAEAAELVVIGVSAVPGQSLVALMK